MDRAGLILSGLYHEAKNFFLTASLMSAPKLSNRSRLSLVWLLAVDHVASGEYSCTSKLLDSGRTVAQLASGAISGLRRLYSSFCGSSEAEGEGKEGDSAASRGPMEEDNSTPAPSDIEGVSGENPGDNDHEEDPVDTSTGPRSGNPPLAPT